MFKFDWHIHLRIHESVSRTGTIDWRDVTLETMEVDDSSSIPFEISFDEYFQLLDSMEGVFVELDGSFVARGTDPHWQLDGLIYDHSDQLSSLELKGSGDFDALATLMSQVAEVFVPQAATLVCEIVDVGVLVKYSDFKSRLLGCVE